MATFCIDTNIIIRDKDKEVITKNTIVNSGISMLGDLLSSTKSLNRLMLSEVSAVNGVDEQMPTDAIFFDIDDYYSVRSLDGKLIVNYEITGTPDELSAFSTIESLGLVSSDGKLFSMADAGSFIVGSTPISITYQLIINVVNN